MKIFTTGQVAKICKVAPRTVAKWFDLRRLDGFTIPGARKKDRRITQESVIRLMRENGMPLGGLEDATVAKVLAIVSDPLLMPKFYGAMKRSIFKVAWVSNPFEAGFKAYDLLPDCTVVDFFIGQEAAMLICQRLRHQFAAEKMAVIALLPVGNATPAHKLPQEVEVFRRPFDELLLVERILTIVRKRKDLG
jgi:hypothetical protein